MKTIIKLIFICFISFVGYHFIQDKLKADSLPSTLESAASEVNADSFAALITKMNTEFDKIKELFQKSQDLLPDWQVNESSEKLEKPALDEPTRELFSIYNVQIGDQKQEIEKKLGKAKRSSLNEYGTKWYTYHQNYQQFVMISYDSQNQVSGLYTNQDLISSKNGIHKGASKETVLKTLGEPLTQLEKGFVFYKLPADRDYEMFHLDDQYVTIFFDKHEDNTVTAMQIIDESLEKNRNDFYTKSTTDLKQGFEYQLFDLTNASRVNNSLTVLKWDDRVKDTARKHSLDMAEHNYFSHTNLEGQSPFDRMLEMGIRYTMAGENLAYGQYSSIFAHEGLMNSLGHRENILQKDFRYLGVGVAFNTKSQPYYTENFITK
ncbi:CAP-associated domain-containing protein [Niallia sp. NCCP-28]|uniref:CAP domain-containing protein n=1 Tax=Niallia sp. NCCP-28 TaxID=2934712 RepID=UPI00208A54CA|nr:CAP-associated domain-containing protein [Niallia sp. NCCP-28]GKU82875.1 CAP domain-containing protein [Niallia sp. NCCP-28]